MPETTFKDSVGRVWDVTLNLGAARRVDKSDFSLLTKEPFSIINAKKETFASLLSNPSLLFAIIWAVVQPQAKRMFTSYQGFINSTTTTTTTNPAILDRADYPNLPDHLKHIYFPFDPTTEEGEMEFVSSIDGTAKDAGTEAFWRSLGDFFPDLATALSMMMVNYKRGKQKLSAKVESLAPEMEKEIDKLVEQGYQEMKSQLFKTLESSPGETSTE